MTRSVFVPEIAASFPYRWLRDSCQCSACVHPSTLQKLHKSSDISDDSHPAGMELTGHELRISWQGDPRHESVYSLEWLRDYSSSENRNSFHKDIDRFTWTSSQLHRTPHLFVDYTQLHQDSSGTLIDAITQLIKYGILFVKNVPNDVTDDRDCELRRLASTFGRIRDTFYGNVWNVKNIRNSANIAYTNIELGLHMDLLYFQHPPQYQILHCLRNRVQGGTSIFIDAIHTAQKLYTQSPSSFNVLAQTPVSYHYINDGHHMHHSHPIISLSPFHYPNVEHINYSPPFQAPLPIDTPDEFYGALEKFAKLLEISEDRFEHDLGEGEAVVFDNRRVLHARTAFHEVGHTSGGESSRWLKGCYLEADDVLDLGRRLKDRTALSSIPQAASRNTGAPASRKV